MSSVSFSIPDASSDGMLAAFFEGVTDAVITKDLNGVVTSWNIAAEQLFGYAAGEVIGQRIQLIFPRDRLDEEPKIIARVLRGERIQNYRTVRRHRSGDLIDVSLNVAPLRGPDGQISGIFTIARDLREQSRTEEHFRTTLSSIGDAVMSTDTDGRVTFMNHVAEQLTGWKEPEALGRPLEEVFRIVSHTTREPAESPVAKVLREGAIVGLANHTVLIARGGREIPIDDSAAPIRTGSGRLAGVVLVFRDVTEKYRADLTARRLAAIVEGSDDAIIAKNLRGIVTDWNPAAERVFGYAAAEMVGQSITKLLPPDRPNEEQQILARLQRGERLDHFETKRRRKDGRIISVSLTISPIRDADGHIVGASKIARDVTAQKESEHALRAAQTKLEQHALELEKAVNDRTARLQQVVSELEAFSYSLSHDLRAPLRAIQGFTEIVLSDYGERIPEATEYLQRVVSATTRMDRLIQDVLAFARVSRQDISVEPLDVEKLVQDLIRERPELQAPRAALTVQSPLLPVVGHDASLTQCLTNLLDNAVKYVRPGTMPVVRVYTEMRGDNVRIAVQDNGIGIDAEGQRRLYTAFQRLPGSQQYQGTGVGLAIVRKAAERMHGSVGVTSAPGAGSTFWVELPKVK